MTKEIDERVVSMRFDNKQFESNVKTSSKSLSDFNKKLQLNGATKGLTDIDAASKKINFSPLGSAVEKVGMKFSALEVVAVTALANITNSAVNAGKRMISALTIDPIKTGFEEYETQINAVQTILANTESKGTTLQDVNRALDELNTYADKTIYNFTEMTRNIGTFTAAGVDLDTSVNAIQGIANLAAVSGSNSQQASTAMYQLSQALSSGSVKLMDWNSVVNAGMGGQVFQNALMETAKVHGVAIDKMIEEEGSFRETLQKGWLTSEVLTETLSHFTMAAEEGTEQWEAYKKSLMDQGYTKDQAVEILKLSNTATDAATKVKTFTQLWDTLKESAQSGWTQSWKILVGDFGEAKSFLTEMSESIGSMIGASADARNAVLSGGLSSGWKQLLSAGIADEEGYKDSIKSVAKEHKISIDDMIKAEKKLDTSLDDNEAFNKVLKKGLNEGTISSDMLSESVYKLANKMTKMSAEERKAAGYTEDHVQQINKLAAGLRDGSISMEEFTTKIARSSGRENIIDALRNSFRGLMSIITPIKEAFREIFPRKTGEELYSFTETLKVFTEKLTVSGETADKIKSIFKGVFAVFDIGIQLVKAIASAFGRLMGFLSPAGGKLFDLTAKFGDFLVNLDENIKSTNIFNKAIAAVEKALQPIIKGIKIAIIYIKEFTRAIGEAFSKQMEKINTTNLEKAADNIRGKLEPLSAMTKGIQKIFSALGKVLLGVCKIFVFLGSKIADAFGGMSDGISDFVSNISIERIIDIINGGLLAAIALGIKKLIDSFRTITDNVGGFFENINGILNGVQDTLKAYQQNLKASVLLKIAVAIGILAASLLVISTIDPEKLASSLLAVGTLFGELMLTLSVFEKTVGSKKGKGLFKASTSLIGLSVAVLILSSALVKISSLNWNQLMKGLVGVGVLMGILTVAAKSLSKSEGKLIKGAFGLIAFAGAIVILTKAVENLAHLDTKSLIKGLIGVGVLVAELALFIKITNETKMGINKGLGLVLLATAINILAGAVAKFGELSLSQIIKGLAAIGVVLLEIAAFMKLTGNAKKLITTAISMTILGAALKIIASVLKDLGNMSLSQIGKGLLAMAGGLASITIAMNLMPKGMINKAIGLIGVATALVIISNVLDAMGSMSWVEIAKSLVVLAASLTIFAIALNAMKHAVSGAAAMLVLSAALAMLTPQLIFLGKMSWGEIARGLTALAGAFAIIGIAALVLKPLTAQIFMLAGAIALLGVGVTLIGAGILAFSAGLTAISIAGAGAATAIVAIVSGLLGLIPVFFRKIAEGIVAICDVITLGAPAIYQAVKTVVYIIIDVLIDCVPAIVDGVLTLLVEVLASLGKYIGPIVDGIFVFLVELLNGVARNIPSLIGSVVNIIMAFFQGVIDALNGLDPEVLVKGILGVGFITALMAALAACASLAPAAMIGVLGVSAVITELGIILAAFGAISKGFDSLIDLIDRGGDLLGSIGTAIGKFIGGIIGGVMSGVSSNLPQIGSDLSKFMKNIAPFIDGAKKIDASTMNGVNALVKTILALTAANVLDGITSFIPGSKDLAEFGKEIAALGPYIAKYAKSVKGIDTATVTASASAAKALAEMADTIPNQGGVAAWFAGENSIATFGNELVNLGKGLVSYSRTIQGFDSETVIKSAEAAKALAEMADTIPNQGGVAAWFAGENSIATFGDELVKLGKGLTSYSNAIKGFDPEAVMASADAAKALTNIADNVPNQGGVVSWFTGDNSIADFGNELVKLGEGLAKYSDTIKGFDSAAVVASADAASTLVKLADNVPNQGGVVSWFTGDNSIATFGDELVKLGEGLAKYSDTIKGFDSAAVVASADAAKAIANVTDHIPNQGGVVAWFTGDNSLATLGDDMKSLGEGLASYSKSTKGMNTGKVVESVDAATAIADITKHLPNEGGVKQWFTGTQSISNYSDDLKALGQGLYDYASAVDGMKTGKIVESVDAAIAIADITKHLPNQGGIAAWFTGEVSISSFAGDLKDLGVGLSEFSNSINNVNATKVETAIKAAKPLVDLSKHLPKKGGIAAWFTGEASISSFAGDLKDLGKGLSDFAVSTKNMTEDDCNKIEVASKAAANLAKMTETIPKEGGFEAWIKGTADIKGFSAGLESLGKGLVAFSDSTDGIDVARVQAGADAAKKLASVANSGFSIDDIISLFTDETKMERFGDDLENLGMGLYRFGTCFSGDDIDVERTSKAAGIAKTLGEMAKNLPENDLLTTLLTGKTSLAAFHTELADLGEGLWNFAWWVSGNDIDIDKASRSADIIKGIAGVYKYLPEVDGFLDFFTGEKNLNTFSAGLSALGRSLSTYYDTVKDINIATLTSTVNNIHTMVSLLTNEKYDLDHMLDMITALSKLKSLGTIIKEFYDSASDISVDTLGITKQVFANIKELFDVNSKTAINASSFETAASCIEDIAYALHEMSDFSLEGSTEAFITMVDDLGAIGKGLADFSSAVEGLDSDGTGNAEVAARNLAAILATLAPYNMTLVESYADAFGIMGASIRDFGTSIAGTDEGALANATAALRTLSTVVTSDMKVNDKLLDTYNRLPDIGSNLSKFNDLVGSINVEAMTNVKTALFTINDIATKLDSNEISDVAVAVSEITDVLSSVSAMKNISITNFVTSFNELANLNVKGFSNALDVAIESLDAVGMSAIDAFVSGATSQVTVVKPTMKSVGESLTKNLSDGITIKNVDAEKAMTSIVKNCEAAANTVERLQGFKLAGSNLVKGFANGITSFTFLAKARARAMARASIDAAESELGIESPSKVFYGIGINTGMGYINALSDYEDKVGDAGSNLGRASIKGISNAVSKISDAINGDLDVQPTIRPVMDLTDVKTGAESISSMFSRRRTLSIRTGTLGAISASMASRQNGSESREMISALKDLRNDVVNMPRNNYSIGNISYEEGSDVAEALQTIIRATRVGKRV